MDEKKPEDYHFLKEQIKKMPADKKKMGLSLLWVIVLAVIFGMVAALVFSVVRPAFQKMNQPQEEPEQIVLSSEEEEQEPAEEPAQEEQQQVIINETQELELSDYQKLQDKLYEVGRSANYSVVSITSTKNKTDWYDNSYTSQGEGAGVIIAETSTSYMIVTNRSLIADANAVSVGFYDSTGVEAEMVASDGATGIAVLSVKKDAISTDTKDNLVVASLGGSAATTQGTMVIAIGSPQGEPFSVLTGNVVATGEVLSTSDANYNVLTTDIVNLGNSSGALIDLNGKVIGLILQDDSNAVKALGISEIRNMVEKLLNGDTPAYLGVEISAVDDTISNEYEIPVGIYVKSVDVDSPAMTAGIQTGDVITSINNVEVLTESEFESCMSNLEPDQEAKVILKRQGANGYQNVECSVLLSQKQ